MIKYIIINVDRYGIIYKFNIEVVVVVVVVVGGGGAGGDGGAGSSVVRTGDIDSLVVFA